MTIKPGIAVIAAVSSIVLTFGNTAHAAGPNFLGYPHSIAADNQLAIPQPLPIEIEKPIEYPMLPTPPQTISAESTPKIEAPEIIAIATETKTIITASTSSSVSRAYASNSSGNSYAWGQCTWYAKSKRSDLPNNLGNGGQWATSAAHQGFATGSTPRAGAIGEQPGHVVYVESVNGDGTVNISEMNYNGRAGVVHTRTVAASAFTYIY